MENAMIRAAIVACLDVRFLLSHDHYKKLPLAEEQMQISSNLRYLQVIPAHQEFLYSGYALEPLVAEAAANILHLEKPENVRNIIQIADRLFNHYFKAKGERGEFISRFLLTVAHDKAVVSYPLMDPQMIYSKPVRVIDFLKCLFVEDHHSDLLRAKPEQMIKDEKTLENAFENAYINFTQFCRAADDRVCHVSFAWQGLVRGVAIQCCGNQKGVDIVIPIVFTPKADQLGRAVLGSPSVSAIIVQVKNRRVAKKVSFDIDKVKFFDRSDTAAIHVPVGNVDGGGDARNEDDADEESDDGNDNASGGDDDDDNESDDGDDNESDDGNDSESDSDDDSESDNGDDSKSDNDDSSESNGEDDNENIDECANVDDGGEGNQRVSNKHPYIFIVMELGVKKVAKTKRFKVQIRDKSLNLRSQDRLEPKARPQYKVVVKGLQDVYAGIGNHEKANIQSLLSATTYKDDYNRSGPNRERGLAFIAKTGVTVSHDSPLIPLA